MNTTRLFSLTLVAAALAACASTPQSNAALDQARSRFNTAQADSRVATLAPEELKRAGDSLRAAESARSGGASASSIDHLAYMTSQRVVIAQETAASRSAQAVTAGAGAERDKLRLEVRTNEADMAQQQLAKRSNEVDAAERQLALSQQSNAQKTAELAAADAAAKLDQARVERRDARVNDLEMQLKDLNAKKTDRGLVVTLSDVLFDTGKSELLPEGARNMAKLAEVFKRNPQRKALIEGYTDSVGSASSNVDLSNRRANSVMSALVNLGVAADHLSTRGFGADQPAASNSTAAGRQMNRRVEIVFAPQGDEISLK